MGCRQVRFMDAALQEDSSAPLGRLCRRERPAMPRCDSKPQCRRPAASGSPVKRTGRHAPSTLYSQAPATARGRVMLEHRRMHDRG